MPRRRNLDLKLTSWTSTIHGVEQVLARVQFLGFRDYPGSLLVVREKLLFSGFRDKSLTKSFRLS